MDEKYEKCQEYVSGSEYNSFIEWVETEIVPWFTINSDGEHQKWVDYWKAQRLSYPSVIYWVGWLSEKSIKFEGVKELGDCRKSEDCCECEEFMRRGGNDILNSMKRWLTGVTVPTDIENEELVPHANFEISITAPYSPIGNGFIAADDYELGVDYSAHTKYKKKDKDTQEPEKSRPVVIHDDKVLVNLGNASGYAFDNTYMEPKFEPKHWEEMTLWKYYGNEEYGRLYKEPYTYYGYKTDNSLVTGTTSGDVANQLYDEFVCEDVNYGYVMTNNGTIVPYERGELFSMSASCVSDYLKDKLFVVYREEYPQTPYIMVNGVKYKATFDSTKFGYYFDRYDKGHEQEFGMEPSANPPRYYIKNGEVYTANTGVTEILTYGYLDGVRYVVSASSVESDFDVWFDGSSQNLTSLTYTDISYNLLSNTITCQYKNKVVYNINHVYGTTSSKLLDLGTAPNIVYDDNGNPIKGTYNSQDFWSPPEGTVLDLIYQVGNVSNIQRFSLTDTNVNSTTYVVGNIITAMTFYYVKTNGEIDEATKVDATTAKTSLAAITESNGKKNGNTEYIDDIFCDIVYHNGATLKVTNTTGNQPRIVYELKDGDGTGKDKRTFHTGVKYTETVRFRKTPVNYVVKERVRKPSNNPNKRLNPYTTTSVRVLWIYELIQNKTRLESDIFGTAYNDALVKFEYDIFRPGVFADTSDDTIVSPTYMEDYMVGIVSPRNIDADIYIDRGINSAYEKHLKLGEVSSLENLIKYTNGYYTIQKDS
jgi:hypothetical protein